MSESAIVADFGARPAWRATGKALAFLHDMLTQDVAGLPPGSGALGALLTEKGRLRAVVRVLADGDGALIDAEPACEEGIEEGLARLAPLAGVEMNRENRRLLRVAGASAELDAAVGPAEHDHAAIDGAVVVRTRWGGAGLDVLATPEHADAWMQRLARSARRADPRALEAARIRDGRPAYGVDVGAESLVNETPLLERAVSFTKGCYPGQESVARVHNLGRTRRRVAVLQIDGAPPAPETAVQRDGEDIGRVTSAAADGDGSVALATIEAVTEAGDATLAVAGSRARVLP